LYEQAVAAGHMNEALANALTARAAELGAPAKQPKQEQAASEEPHPDDTERILNPGDYGDAPLEQGEDEVHDVEVVEDDDVEGIWFQIIAAAGPLGLTTVQVEERFAEANGGLHPGTANATRLRAFLASLKGARS
jgi:hypothetical protein